MNHARNVVISVTKKQVVVPVPHTATENSATIVNPIIGVMNPTWVVRLVIVPIQALSVLSVISTLVPASANRVTQVISVTNARMDTMVIRNVEGVVVTIQGRIS